MTGPSSSRWTLERDISHTTISPDWPPLQPGYPSSLSAGRSRPLQGQQALWCQCQSSGVDIHTRTGRPATVLQLPQTLLHLLYVFFLFYLTALHTTRMHFSTCKGTDTHVCNSRGLCRYTSVMCSHMLLSVLHLYNSVVSTDSNMCTYIYTHRKRLNTRGFSHNPQSKHCSASQCFAVF